MLCSAFAPSCSLAVHLPAGRGAAARQLLPNSWICRPLPLVHSKGLQALELVRVGAVGCRQAGRHSQALHATRTPDALLFDCDGVLVDTEADGHRVAFNEAFRTKGLTCEWSLEEYGELLEIGGGKERMTAYFSRQPDQEPFKSIQDPAERAAFVKELHLLKTDLFMDMIKEGRMPLRPGVKRLVDEALAAGAQVAVCSTSNEQAVGTIVRVLLGKDIAARMRVFAGDCVPRKKPDPAIYLLASRELGVPPERCAVVEDSRIGLQAALAAGMRCVVTTSSYTANEAFEGAAAVFDEIGDAGRERFSFADLTTDRLASLQKAVPTATSA